MLGGFISIGCITSTATATSDGTTGKVTGSTQVQGVSIAGQQISVTANGISALNESSPALPISALNTLLKELGITIAVTTATDKVSGPSASRELDGLEIQINLDTLDTAANKFFSLLPAKLVSQLPVAIPNEQLVTLVLRPRPGRLHGVPVVRLELGEQRRRRRDDGARRAARRPARRAAAASPATPAPASSPGTFAGNTGTGPRRLDPPGLGHQPRRLLGRS